MQVPTPLEKAVITGAAAIHPARFKNRAAPKLKPAGKPPGWLTKEEKEVWYLFIDEIPWLTRADRTVLEVATRLRTKMMYENPTVPVLNLLRQCLSFLGATPADRGKITHWDGEQSDPIDEHFSN